MTEEEIRDTIKKLPEELRAQAEKLHEIATDKIGTIKRVTLKKIVRLWKKHEAAKKPRGRPKGPVRDTTMKNRTRGRPLHSKDKNKRKRAYQKAPWRLEAAQSIIDPVTEYGDDVLASLDNDVSK